MEIFLAILMALGIFVVFPVIVGFFIVAVYSGLFRVMLVRSQRRMTAFKRKTIQVRRKFAPLGKTVQTGAEPVIGKVA